MIAASWARRYRAQLCPAPYPRAEEHPMHSNHRNGDGA